MKYQDYVITDAGCHLLNIEQQCGQEQATAWGRALLGIAQQRTGNVPADEEGEISKHLATGAIEKGQRSDENARGRDDAISKK